jgi:hypothetical protein
VVFEKPLKPSMAPKLAQHMPNMGPGWSLLGLQWAQMRPRWAQNGPKMVPSWLPKAPLKSFCESWRHLAVTLTDLEHQMAAPGLNMLIFDWFLLYFKQLRRSPQN